jgi:MFS family permease
VPQHAGVALTQPPTVVATLFPTPLPGLHLGRRMRLVPTPNGELVRWRPDLPAPVPAPVPDPVDAPDAYADSPELAAAAVPSAGFGTVVRNRRFMALWTAQIGSLLAANMALYALTLVAFAAGGGSTAVSLLFLSFLAPAVLLSAPAGVIVDRFDRRTLLIVTNLIRAAAFAAIVLTGGQLPTTYLLVIVAATATTFFIPAEAAMIPRVVPAEQLMPANGLFTFTLQAAFALGFAVLGPIAVGVAGPTATVGLAAVLYVVAAGLCLPLPSARPAATEAHHDARAEFAEGIDVIRRDPRVRWPLALLGFTASLIGVVGVLGPQVAVTQLGLSEKEFVLLVLPMAVGLVLGVVALGPLARRLSNRRLAEMGLVGLALGLAALALLRPLADLLAPLPNPQLMLAMPIALAMGAAYALVSVPALTGLQEALPDAVRGRVFAVLNMLVNAASALPILLVGPAADALGVPMVVAACAVATSVLLISSIFAFEPSDGRESSLAVTAG